MTVWERDIELLVYYVCDHNKEQYYGRRNEAQEIINWAMKEAFNYALTHPEFSAMTALEHFAEECDRCALKDNSPYHFFSTAYDVAYDMYDYLMCHHQ